MSATTLTCTYFLPIVIGDPFVPFVPFVRCRYGKPRSESVPDKGTKGTKPDRVARTSPANRCAWPQRLPDPVTLSTDQTKEGPVNAMSNRRRRTRSLREHDATLGRAAMELAAQLAAQPSAPAVVVRTSFDDALLVSDDHDRGTALRTALLATGCTCNEVDVRTSTDDAGTTHLHVAHDDECPLLAKPRRN
jgi:hypothetical protein